MLQLPPLDIHLSSRRPWAEQYLKTMMRTGLQPAILPPPSTSGVLACSLLIFVAAASLCAPQRGKCGEGPASEQLPGDGLVVCRCEADFLAAARSQRAGEAVLFIRQAGAAA